MFTSEQFKNMPRIFVEDKDKKIIEVDANATDDPPVLSPYPFIYFTCDRDPTADEPTYVGYAGLIYFWYNTTSTNLFCCTNSATAGSLVWQEIAMPQNILGILSAVGWKINTTQPYTPRSSPAFATQYTPSLTNDTDVAAIVSLTSTLLTAANINFEVGSGTSFSTIGQEELSGVAETNIRTFNHVVPAGQSYQLINTSGTASIISINERSR